MDPRLVNASWVYAYDQIVFVFAIPTDMECTVNTVCSCRKATKAIGNLVEGQKPSPYKPRDVLVASQMTHSVIFVTVLVCWDFKTRYILSTACHNVADLIGWNT